MLDDRPYMREPRYGSRPPLSWTWILILANLGVFILTEINRVYIRWNVDEYFALSNEGLKRGFVWQIITFQFLHAGLSHFLLNMLGLFFCGKAMEQVLGGKRYLQLYFLSGIAGGILQCLLGFISPIFGGAVVGASASLFGLIAAFTRMYPEQQILLMFVIPVKARYFLWGAIGISVFYILVPGGQVAHGAHLGGILAGVLYVRYFIHGNWTLSMPSISLPRRAQKTQGGLSRPAWRTRETASASDIELPPADFISREVDPILDKISAHGIQSLTERERKILEAARAKMARR